MPEVPLRQLSFGEVQNKDRRRYVPKRLQPVLTAKQVRRKNRCKKRDRCIPDYRGSNRLVRDTAKAWGMSYKDTKNLFSWIDSRISPDYRSLTLTKLLRRKYAERNKSSL